MTREKVDGARRRMSRQDRHADLLAASRDLIRDVGTDEFTLGRLAQRAGVTKPLVYDHFGDRAGVLAELYREFEAHQRATLISALEESRSNVAETVDLVAAAYIDCCVAEGQEMADVVAALAGSSTLSAVRQEAEDAYLHLAQEALQPHAGPIGAACMHALTGAGDALARNVLTGGVSVVDARSALARVLGALMLREPTHTKEEDL